MNTTTTGTTTRIIVQAVRWIELQWHILKEIPTTAPFFQAAAKEYKRAFNRDLERDVQSVKEGRGEA